MRPIVTITVLYQLVRAGFKCVEALGRIIIGRQEGHPACKKQSGGGAGVAVCLEQGADNSVIYI